MQNSATFDKIFLPQFKKQHFLVACQYKRQKNWIYYLLFHSNNSVHCLFKGNLWGKCLFISTSPMYVSVEAQKVAMFWFGVHDTHH